MAGFWQLLLLCNRQESRNSKKYHAVSLLMYVHGIYLLLGFSIIPGIFALICAWWKSKTCDVFTSLVGFSRWIPSKGGKETNYYFLSNNHGKTSKNAWISALLCTYAHFRLMVTMTIISNNWQPFFSLSEKIIRKNWQKKVA